MKIATWIFYLLVTAGLVGLVTPLVLGMVPGMTRYAADAILLFGGSFWGLVLFSIAVAIPAPRLALKAIGTAILFLIMYVVGFVALFSIG